MSSIKKRGYYTSSEGKQRNQQVTDLHNLAVLLRHYSFPLLVAIPERRIGAPYVEIKGIVTGKLQNLCLFPKEVGILFAPFATGGQLLLLSSSYAYCVGSRARHSAQLHTLHNFVWEAIILKKSYSTGNK